jgi:hypothetical protein
MAIYMEQREEKMGEIFYDTVGKNIWNKVN